MKVTGGNFFETQCIRTK